MTEESDAVLNLEVVDVVVERHYIETLIRRLLSDIDCFYRHPTLKSPRLDVLSSHIGDLVLKLQSEGRERGISSCRVFDIETGAAANLEQPGGSGDRKGPIDGFDLECFHCA